MGFDLTDIANQDRIIFVNSWNWRPTVEIIREAGFLDPERLDGLHEQCCATRVSKEEAHAIAKHLRQNVLPSLSSDSRVLLDGSITAEVDNGNFYRAPEESHKNYSATRIWLEQFAAFCEASEGFELN